jgi:hypothetical protein
MEEFIETESILSATLTTLSDSHYNIWVMKGIYIWYMTFVILILYCRQLNPGTDKWRLHWRMPGSWPVEAMTIMMIIYRWVLNICEIYCWDSIELFYAIFMAMHGFILSDFQCRGNVYFENICKKMLREKYLTWKRLITHPHFCRLMWVGEVNVYPLFR